MIYKKWKSHIINFKQSTIYSIKIKNLALFPEDFLYQHYKLRSNYKFYGQFIEKKGRFETKNS